MADIIGKILVKRYRVDSFIGRGGMAEVYKVWDQQRAVYLAMKLLREDIAEDKIFLRRFTREAQTLAKLQHPHIVRFYGLEQDDDLAFMLMEYVEGTTLRKEIFRAREPIKAARVLEVMRPVCSALHFAHTMDMVHCDLKPGNVMIHTGGNVLVTDFGIARMTDAATATMVGLGTPAYMAPEQARGADPTPQTDIYALGIVLYEMLTGGERPFTGERATTTGSTSEKVRWEQMHLQPPSPCKWNPDITSELETVVLRCLAKEQEKRFSSALDLLNALLSVFGESAGEVKVPTGSFETPGQAEQPSAENPAVVSEPHQPGSTVQTTVAATNRNLIPWLVVGGLGIIAILGWVITTLGQPSSLEVTQTALVVQQTQSSVAYAVNPTKTIVPIKTKLSTSTETATPTQTRTYTQSPTFTLTQTPTLSQSSTVIISITPSPIPEGLSIIPDVVGLDFYTAGLRLQDSGFVVIKESEYRPDVTRNLVFKQEPAAGTWLKQEKEVTIFIAEDSMLMYTLTIDSEIEWEWHRGKYMYFTNLPAHTWCQASLVYDPQTLSGQPNVEIYFYEPDAPRDSRNPLATLDSILSRSEFETTIAGEYQIDIRSIRNVEVTLMIYCKPEN